MDAESHSEDINLQEIWLVLKRRWPILAGVFLASLGLGMIASKLRPPVYQAEGKLLVQSNRTPSLTGVGEEIGRLPTTGVSNPLVTQVEILGSLPILQQVVDTLHLKDQEGRPLNPRLLPVKAEPIAGSDILEISFQAPDPQQAAAVVNALMKAYISNNLLTNRAEALAAGDFIAKQLPKAEVELEQAAETLRRFKSQNQIIDLPGESSATVQSLSNLNDELNKVQADLAEVTAQQVSLSQQVRLPAAQAVDIASLSQSPGVQEVLVELQKVQTKLATERSRYRGPHPTITTLQKQEIALNALLQDRIRQAVGGSNLQVPPGALQIGDLKRSITSDFVKLETQRLGLQNKLAALVQLRAAYQRRASALPTLEKQQVSLERRLEVAKKTYENLSSRLQDTQVAENQTLGNARVIQFAAPPTDPYTSKLQTLLPIGAGLAGLLLGVAAAFLVDWRDKSLRTVREVQTLFDYTLLGLIPKYEVGGSDGLQSQLLDGVSPRVVVTTSPRTVIHEAYQMLLANLKFVSLDKPVRTIVVTSSVPQEGKSEVSANLAATVAQTGRRVLLVDADLRSPSQHHLWGLMNSTGLSNILVGQSQLSDAVQVITSSLSVLPAGVIPPNSVALLDSDSMSTLMQRLSSQYDYVVFDTPPLAGAADAAILGKVADGVLLVSQPGVVDSASATAAKSILMRSEPNILGLVANGVNVKQEPDTYFYSTSPRTDQHFEVPPAPVGNVERLVS
jgi:capsular exopolysaccharide synthesis family protein